MQIKMVNVKLFANLRKAAGATEMDLKSDNLNALLSALAEQKPALGALLLENGQVRPHVIITINGHPTIDMGTALKNGDQIAIFPPIAGGSTFKEKS